MQKLFIIISIVITIIAVLSLCYFIHRIKRQLYSYLTIFSVGLSIYAFIQMLILYFVAFVIIPQNPYIDSLSLLTVLSGSGFNFCLLSSPIVLIFSILMIISNISLIRHEGKRPVNFLGILLSFILIAAFSFILIIDINFSGDNEAFLLYVILSGIYTQLYSYMVCMLFGTIITAFISVTKKPAYDKDYIIILGCKIGSDGRLFPLIKGRIDAAIKFYNDQINISGKEAIFIPSGGKGPDEGTSESEAMASYLIDSGISPENIIIENKSRTTQENMLFSNKLINKTDSKVAFCTTNYHVLRSGIIASSLGLNYEGIGAKTKWYFYPNAFIREFIGLMVKCYKLQISVILIMLFLMSLLNYYIMIV